MTYKFTGTENNKGQIVLVFKNSTAPVMKIGAGDFFAGNYDQKAISVKEQQQGGAALIARNVDPVIALRNL